MVADNFTTLLSEALSNKTKDNSNRQQTTDNKYNKI